MSSRVTGAKTAASRNGHIFILTSYLLYLVVLVLQFIIKLLYPRSTSPSWTRLCPPSGTASVSSSRTLRPYPHSTLL